MKSNNKITKDMVEDIISLTPLQEGMLFHYLKNPDSNQYFEQLSLEVDSSIDTIAFKKAWNNVVKANEMLRTVFRWKKIKKPVQMVLKKHDVEIIHHDISNEDNGMKDRLLEEIKTQDRENKFDLESVPFRINLCKVDEKKYYIIISNHHIIYDGWSTGIILKEFIQSYEWLVNGEMLKAPNKNKIKEFIKSLQRQDIKKQNSFWKEYLEGFQPREGLSIKTSKYIDLPNSEGDFSINDEKDSHCDNGEEYYQNKENEQNKGNSNIDRFRFQINSDIERLGSEFIKDQKITLASLLYSVWGILLSKYTNSDDVVFGTTVSGRNAKVKGIEEMVGLFINTLPLRVNTTKMNNVIDLLEDVKQSLQERQAYESSSLVKIKEASGIKSSDNLFDSLVVIENYPLDNVLNNEGESLAISNYFINEETNFDLTVGIELVDGMEITFTYNKDKFSHKAIKRMGQHFQNIFKEIVSKGQNSLNEGDLNKIDLNTIGLNEIKMMTENEREELLYQFNNTTKDKILDSSKYNNLCQLFEEQVERTPDNIAIIYKDNKLTYRELNQRANGLARKLREKGIQQEDIVGIMTERSIERIIGIFGVLKAGGAYLPIDPSYPQDRIKYMIEDSGCKMLLIRTDLVQDIEYEGEVLNLNDDNIYNENNENLEIINKSENMAYMIYTSGSTGKPKGVMVEHRNILNTIYWRKNEYKLDSEDNVLQLFSFSFDGFLTSFFTPIVSGASVVLLDEYQAKDPIAIKDKIREETITHFICVPSLYDAILESSEREDLKSINIVTLAGERVTNNLIKKSKDKNSNIEIVNEYGPTENSVATTIERNLVHTSKITIGKPVVNTQVYILDKNNELLPIGVAGELCVSGNGVTRGYLNRPELTKEKFIDNPFNPDKKLYKTGDLARWMDDGSIDFIGRIDNQVKIRGYRIELGEIERHLLKLDYIKEAVVLAKERENKDKYLCGYIVAENSEGIQISELKKHLSSELPDYMIPTYFVELDKFPVTPNGKIDRKALPEADGKMDMGVEHEVARNEIEEKLVKIWEEILDVNDIGINDNFFDLGGHSLKITTLVAKIHKELDVEIPLNIVYDNPNIKGISEYIIQGDKSFHQSIKATEEKEYYPLSSAQKRMYVVNQFDKDSTKYNMQLILKIDKKITKDKIQDIMEQLINRHESLRTSFELVDKEPMQKIHKEVDFKLHYQAGKEEEVEAIANQFVQPFDLEKAPLLRGQLVKVEEDNHILILDMHHIISDEVSIRVLVSEFIKLYNNQVLPELKIQYKDYSVWQKEQIDSGKFIKQEEYWLDKFKGDIPILELEKDFEGSKKNDSKGDRVRERISAEILKGLKQVSKDNSTTMFTILLEIYAILLSKYTGQEDIVIGTPSSGRNYADLENITGMFVNTVPLRLYPKGEEAFKDFLREIKNDTIEAFENQDYQLEMLVKKLRDTGKYDRDSLFDTLFTYHNMSTSELKDSGLEILQYDLDLRNVKFDLTLSLVEMKDSIELEIQYDTSLFKRATIEKMIRHFMKIVDTVVENPNMKIADITILDEAELEKMASKTEGLKKEISIDFDF